MLIDAESRKFLEEVRKGKPRRFAMICKGVKILNLIVYKKGSQETYKKRIQKADGAGQFFGGVVSGKGKNIVFELLSEDYDKTPGKDLLLKQFLADEAGMSLKPVYSIVPTLTAVDSSDDTDEVDPGIVDTADPNDSSAAVSKTPHATSADEPAAEPRKALLERAMAKLKPSIQQACEAQPACKTEVTQSVVTIKKTLADSAFDQTQQQILQLGRRLKEIIESSRGPTSSEAASPVATERKSLAEREEEIAAQLHDALESHRPMFDQVIDANPDVEDELIDTMSDIVDQIRAKQFAEARGSIDAFAHALAHLLNASGSDSAESPATESRATAEGPTKEEIAAKREQRRALATEFKERFVALMPAIKEAQADASADSAQVAKLLKQAQQQGQARDFEAGHATLDEIQNRLAALHHASPNVVHSDDADQFESLFHSLMETIPADLQRLHDRNDPAAGEVQKVVDAAASHAQSGDFKAAFTMLEQAAEAIANATGAARVASAAEVIPAGKVAETREAILKAKIRWDDGIKRAAAELKKVQDGYRDLDSELAWALGEILKGYQNELAEVLTLVEKQQDDGGVDDGLGDALALVAKLRREFATEELFALLDAYPAANVSLQATLDSALAQVQNELTHAS